MGIYDNPIANIIPMGKTESSSSKIRNETRCLLSSLLLQYCKSQVQQEKAEEYKQKKGKITPLYRWHDPVFKKPLRLYQETYRPDKHFQQKSRISIYKISSFSIQLVANLPRNCFLVLFFFFPLKSHNSFKTNSIYPGTNISKEQKELDNTNFKTLKKEIEDTRR